MCFRFWQHIFQCNLAAGGGYADGCVNGLTFADSDYHISDTVKFSIEAAKAVVIINDLVESDYCASANSTFQVRMLWL